MIGTIAALTVAALAVLSIGEGLRHIVDGGFAAGKADALDHALAAIADRHRGPGPGDILPLLLRHQAGRAGGGRPAQGRLRPRPPPVDPAFFLQTRTGEVLSRMTTDIAVVESLLGTSVIGGAAQPAHC